MWTKYDGSIKSEDRLTIAQNEIKLVKNKTKYPWKFNKR